MGIADWRERRSTGDSAGLFRARNSPAQFQSIGSDPARGVHAIGRAGSEGGCISMRYVFLIARREFLEAAKTKGFWIGIMLFPAMLFLMTQAPMWLDEKVTPVRYFVLVDQSGTLASVIE